MNFFKNFLHQFQQRNPDIVVSKCNKSDRSSDQKSNSMISEYSINQNITSDGKKYGKQPNDLFKNSNQNSAKVVEQTDSCKINSNVDMLCNMEEENITNDSVKECIDIEKCLIFYKLEKLAAVDDKASSKKNEGDDKYFKEVNDLEDVDSDLNKLDNTQQNCTKHHRDNEPICIYDNSKLNEEIHTTKFDSELLISGNLNTNVENNVNSYNDSRTTIPDIEVISISSDDQDSILINKATDEKLNAFSQKPLESKIEIDIHSDCSYHSSDFEFITEDEAVFQELSTDYLNPEPSCSKFPSGFSTMPNKHSSSQASSKNEVKVNENTSRKEGLVHSRQNFNGFDSNRPKTFPRSSDSLHDPNNFYHRDRFRPSNNVDCEYGPLHNAIPEGEGYLDLFRGIYDPVMPLSSIHMMENKSVRSTGMNVEFEGIGFDMQLMRNMDDSSQEEYESEAQEVAKDILRRYPAYNRKRRRRN